MTVVRSVPEAATSADLDIGALILPDPGPRTFDTTARTAALAQAAPADTDIMVVRTYPTQGHVSWLVFAPPAKSVRFPDLPPGLASVYQLSAQDVWIDLVDLDGTTGDDAALRARIVHDWYLIDNNVYATPFRKRGVTR
jgi:hypothetical protein